MDYEAWKLHNEEEKKHSIKLLREWFPTYETILGFTATLIVQGLEAAEERKMLLEEIRSAKTFYTLVDIMDRSDVSRSAVLAKIKKHAAEFGEESPAARSIAKAVDAVELMHKTKIKAAARRGPEVRKAKMELLRAETIRLFEHGTWKSVPAAAQEITPKIIALSKDGNGDLLPTTTKPLEWIRAYKRACKK